MKRLANDRGSVLVFVVLFCTVLVAVAGLTMDFGSWYSEKQKLQGTADAAALAAAQDLPNTGTASATATQYANDNNSGLDTWTPAFPNDYTVTIDLGKTSPAYFAKIVGVESKHIVAHAQAQVGTPTELRNVLPIGVNQNVVCTVGSTGCFGANKILTFDDSTTASFHASTWGLMDVGGGSTGTTDCQGQASDSDITSWIQNGYPGTLPVNQYFGGVNGQKSTQNALNTQISKPLLVPVFDDAQASWCKNPAKGGFHIVGWAALIIDQTIPDSDWSPHVKTLHVHFIEYIVHDVESKPGYTGFGIKTIKLSQ
jgi:Putative Flp pilus-assembly TadE/G-like